MGTTSQQGGLGRLKERFARGSGGDNEASDPLDRVRSLLARWRKRGRRWESHAYYPAILDLSGRTALVVGAGSVGEGKVRGLLAAGANVRVVSLDATDAVRRWADEARIELRLGSYEEDDLEGCFLVVAATQDNDTNVRVFEHAEARRMLCNVVDVPRLCNFILPSIMRRGDLAIAVSTAGASPALARRIRLALEQWYGDEYDVALELLGSLREEAKTRYPDPGDRKVLFERMVYSGFVDMVRAGDVEGLEAWIDRCMAEGPHYASPEEHRAMLARAKPEGRLGLEALEIESSDPIEDTR
jgi:precorrin-2 dehydrogenase / sirohydrochlorin ferrochelatase